MAFNAIAEKNKEKESKKKTRRFFNKKRRVLNDIYPVVSLTADGFVEMCLNNNTFYMAMLDTKSYDLYFLDEVAADSVMTSYWDLHKKYTLSLKEIYVTVSENNRQQQTYYQYKIEHTTDRTLLYHLDKELEKLQMIEENYEKYSTYPCIFGDTVEELQENLRYFRRSTDGFLDTKLLPADELTQVMYGLNNRFGGKHVGNKDTKEGLSFQDETKPKGGISFRQEAYNVMGDGYSACLHVVSKPTILHEYWIDQLVREENTFVVVDYLYMEDVDHLGMLDSSIEEVGARWEKAQKTTLRDSLEKDQQTLRHLYQDINSSGEKIKHMHVRFFFREATIDQLQKKMNDFFVKLDSAGFGATVFLDEQKEEWQSIFLPFDKQLQLPTQRGGLAIPSEALGIGFGYNQTNLSDPTGKYYGYTTSGGTIYLDIFHKTNTRLSYNTILLGDMGSGKSTLLKSLTKDNLEKGNYIRGFDKAGEMDKLLVEFSGKKINLDGSDGSINFMQIFPISTSNPDSMDDTKIDIPSSFATHISLQGKKYGIYNKDAESNEITLFTSLCRSFYRQHDTVNDKNSDLFSLPNNAFPILEDLYHYIKHLQREDSDELRKPLISSILLNLESMIEDYGALFNHQTTIEDLGSQQLVIFDINSLAGMDEKVFDIQFFSAMTLIQQNLMALGRHEKYAFDNNHKHWWDIKRSLIVNDECHNTLNVTKLTALEMYTILMSEGRKFFIGLLNATQKADRLFPSMGNVSDKSVALAASKLKEIIGLSQYKVILKQDETSIPMLRQVFGETFTDDEYRRIPTYKTGESGSQGVLSIAGDMNLQVTFEVTKEDLQLFDGGA